MQVVFHKDDDYLKSLRFCQNANCNYLGKDFVKKLCPACHKKMLVEKLKNI